LNVIVETEDEMEWYILYIISIVHYIIISIIYISIILEFYINSNIIAM